MTEAYRQDSYSDDLPPDLTAVRQDLLHAAEELEANPVGPAWQAVVRLRRQITASPIDLVRYGTVLEELRASKPVAAPTPLMAVRFASPSLEADGAGPQA